MKKKENKNKPKTYQKNTRNATENTKKAPTSLNVRAEKRN